MYLQPKIKVQVFAIKNPTYFSPGALTAGRRSVILLALVILALAPVALNFMAGSLLASSGASAQDTTAGADSSTESIKGKLTIREPDGDGDGFKRVGVPEVTIMVFWDGDQEDCEENSENSAGQESPVSSTVSRDGDLVGQAVSNASGNWEIPVPSKGCYSVSLDTSTLPDDIGLTYPDRHTLTDQSVSQGQSKAVAFSLGDPVKSSISRAERLANLVFSGLRFGAILALCSVGLSLVFGVTGLINFAHGEIVTLGALVAFYLHASDDWLPNMDLLFAVVPAMVIVGILSAGLEIGLWRPLRTRQVSLVSMSLATIGISFILRYFYLVVFNASPRPYRDYNIQETIQLGWISTPPKNLLIIIIAIMLLSVLGLFLLLTRTGTAIRAVAANRELASVSGIHVPNVMLLVWFIGAAYSALGGIMYGISEQIEWEMGFQLLLWMFASVILGGIGTAFGAMLGGFLIGLITEVSTYWIDSEFKLAVGLAVLIIMLLIRPQGLLGQRVRTA